MIALVSDTHLPRGMRTLPVACIELLRQASLIVHAGDFTAVTALEQLEAIGPPVAAVHGNRDEPALRTLLPARAIVDAEGLKLGIVHDAGPRRERAGRLRSWFPGCAAIVYGHSHLPEVAREAGVWILNPGSPTDRRRSPAHTMILIREGVPALVEV